MSNSDQKIGTADQATGSLDLDHALRVLLAETIKTCPKKRQQVAEELSALVGRSISEAMLNSYTADSKEAHRFPAAWIPAFCVVTGDSRLIEIIASRCGMTLVSERGLRLIEFAEAILEKERGERKAEAARTLLAGDRA